MSPNHAHNLTRFLSVFVVFWLLPAVAAATVIHVEDPGAGRGIRPNLEAAFGRAGSGDTVLLPAGSFRFSGSIVVLVSRKPDIRLKGAGAAPGPAPRTGFPPGPGAPSLGGISEAS